MRRTKYIVGEVADTYCMVTAAIVFPESLTHKLIAERVLTGPAHSAGFCYIDGEGKAVAYGESVSLNLKSRPEDATLIARALSLDVD